MANSSGSSAASLLLGIQTAQALQDLKTLRDGLSAFKQELAQLSGGSTGTATLTAEINRLKKELEQVKKTSAEVSQSWVRGNKEQEQAAKTLTRTLEEENRKQLKSAEDTAKKIAASKSQSAKIGGISYSVRESMDAQVALNKIKEAQLVNQLAASAPRIDPRTLLGLPTRDSMKSIGAEIAAQFREGARLDAQKAASASRIDPRTLLGLPTRDSMKSIGAEIAAQFRDGVKTEAQRAASAPRIDPRALLGLPSRDSAKKMGAEIAAQFREGARLEAQRASQNAKSMNVETLLGIERANKSAKLSANVFTSYGSGMMGPSRDELVAMKANYDAKKQVEALAASKRNLSQANDEAAKKTHHFTESQKMLHSTLRGVSGALGYLWLTYGQYIPQMVAGFAAVTAAQKSFQQGIEYDYQTKFVAALSENYTPDAYKGIQQGLEGIKDVPVDLNELAQGLRVMQQTGIDAAQGLGLLETSISASILGEVNMKTATEDLVGVLEVFGMHSDDPAILAKNFNKAGDVMAYVSQETKANLHDVASSMQNITGVAQQYGVSIEEATGALILLNKQGIVGAKSGTYVRSMIESLYVPNSKKAERAFAEIDFSPIDKATGKYKDMGVMVDELVRKIKQYDAQSQAKLIDSLFETWGAKAFRGIFNNLDEFNRQIDQAKNNTEGLLKTQTERLSESTKIQLDKLKSEFNNLFTLSFEANPDVQAAIQALRDTIANPEVRDALSSLVSGVATLFRVIAQNLPTLVAFGEGLASFYLARGALTVIGGASAGFMTLAGSLAAATGAMGPTMTGMTGLAAALRFIPGPIGLISTALGLGVTAWALWGKSAEDASKRAVVAVQEAAKAASVSLANFKADLANASATAVRSAADKAKSELDNAWNGVNERRKKVAAQYGLDERDLRGDFNTEEMARKASGLKFNIYPTLDALKKENKEVAALRNTTLDLYKLSNDRAQVEEQRAAAAKAEAEAVSKQALKTFSGDSGKNGGSGARDANNLMKEQKNEITEVFKHAEALARQNYELETSLLDKKYEKGLLSLEEYNASRKSLEELYQFDVAAAEMEATTQLNKLKEEADKKHQKKMLDNEMKRIYDGMEQKQRANEIERQKKVREAEIDALSEAKKISEKVIPELEAKSGSSIQKAWETRDAELMPSSEKAALEASVRVEQMYVQALTDTARMLEEKKRMLGENAEAVRVLEEQQTKLIESMEMEKAAAADSARALNEYHNSFEYGIKKAWAQYTDSASNSAKVAEQVFTKSMNSMSDALYDFATTGKLNFRSLAQTIINEMLRIQAQKLAMEMGKGGMGLLGGLLGVGSGGSFLGDIAGFLGLDAVDLGLADGPPVSLMNGMSSGLSGISGLFSSLFSLFAANGHAFTSNGVAKFAKGGAFTNAIVSSPTLFKFAQGGAFGLGMMGEAGDEAVMPLARDGQGRLGVRANIAQQQAQPQAVQNNIRVVNAFDTSVVSDYIGSAEGEKVIMNVVKKNPGMVKQLARS